MKGNKRALLVAAALIAVVFTAIYFKEPRKASNTPLPVTLDSPTPISPISSVPIPAAQPSAQLPDVELPLANSVAELKRRFQSGDQAAGCRLASEYMMCTQLAFRRAELDKWLSERQIAIESLNSSELQLEADESFERELPLRQKELDELENHCQGVALPTLAEISEIWRTSALAGNPSAMKQYASGNAFRFGDVLGVLPQLNLYKREAEEIARTAAERGDFDILLSLASAYGPNNAGPRSLLSQAVEPDSARSLAFYMYASNTLKQAGSEDERLARQIKVQIENFERTLTGDELSRADRIVKDELSNWRQPEVRGLGRLDMTGRVPDIDRGWCSR